ncbi:MAG: DUF6273 domain-containing protein [Defluviitaleaceae bacterium]|nr:DUF6273 domain-containing protein [Defluviitaleaceae bacterium]
MPRRLSSVWAVAAVLLFVACGSDATDTLPALPEEHDFRAEINFDAFQQGEREDNVEEEVSEKIGELIQLGRSGWFGSLGYEIEMNWIVLDVRGDRALVLSEYIWSTGEFSESATTWEHSDIREFLNHGFFYEHFDAEEQSRIAEVIIANSDNLITGAEGGEETLDRVFLLSIDEVERLMGEETPLYGARSAIHFQFHPEVRARLWPDGYPECIK